jgi:hypothetical protein
MILNINIFIYNWSKLKKEVENVLYFGTEGAEAIRFLAMIDGYGHGHLFLGLLTWANC